MEAARILADKSVPARVVSMPSWELFEAQPREYRESVLSPAVTRRLSIEAGTTIGWARYVGSEGTTIGIDHYGSSAPGSELFERYGFTPENVAKRALALVEGDML